MPSAAATQHIKWVIKTLLPASTVGTLRAEVERFRLKAHSALSDPLQFERAAPARECPICGYRGRFWSFGSPPRAEALCPECLSLERHRLLRLLIQRRGDELSKARRVVHFAPEPFVRDEFYPDLYVTVDISGYGVDCAASMEALPFPDACFGTVIANHVLEHVASEERALAELKRVVEPAGVVVLSVPQIYGWAFTYEDPNITTPEQRQIHFGQGDHRRLYGRDFADRLGRAGFDVELFQVDPKSEVRYGLNRGETLFIARQTDSEAPQR
jgi:hypothetical protein